MNLGFSENELFQGNRKEVFMLVWLININYLHHHWRTMTHLADNLKDDGRR